MIKNMTLSTWVLWLLILAALGFGFWGWNSQADDISITIGDAIYRTITTLPVSTTLNNSSNWNNDWRIDLARWLGLAAFLLGVCKVVLALLSGQLNHVKARLRKDHLMVIGEHPFAGALANAALRRKIAVSWLGASEAQATQRDSLLFVREGTWLFSEAEKFGIHKAKNVIITTKDDATAIAIARQIRTQIPDEKSLQINVMARSPWLAMRVDDLKNIRLLSQAQIAIRQIHRKHPPFLIAQKQKHRRIHAVIVGFGLYGEAILIDTLLSCLTTYLDKPLFTIIDPRSDVIKSSLELRYPELYKSADINFVDKTIEGESNSLSEDDVVHVSENCPVTIAYVCLSEEEKSLSNALALQALARRHDWMGGPIFAKLSTLGAVADVKAGISEIEPAQLIGFGELDDIVGDTGAFSKDADKLAKIMHQAYLNVAHEDKASCVPWEQLDEDKRESNRRLVIHIAAKLSSIGMDVEPWIKSLDEKLDHPSLPVFTSTVNEEIMEKLSTLEHDRWMADRRLNGWRFGAKRDDIKRIHPGLKPYSELTLKVQTYDKVMVTTLFNILTNPT